MQITNYILGKPNSITQSVSQLWQDNKTNDQEINEAHNKLINKKKALATIAFLSIQAS